MKLTNDQILAKYPEAGPRIIGERKVIRRLCAAAIVRGLQVSVNNGEDWEIKNSKSLTDIMHSIMATDEDYIRLTDDAGMIQATFRMIYGNSPEEVIADHSTNALAEELYAYAHKKESNV